jgi:hypothetical protein
LLLNVPDEIGGHGHKSILLPHSTASRLSIVTSGMTPVHRTNTLYNGFVVGDSILVLIAAIGSVACVALALWNWKRGESAPGTVVIPQQELLRNPIVVSESQTPPPERATEFVPREESFRAADRVRAAEEKLLQPVSEAQSEPPAATEFLPLEKMMEVFSGPHRTSPNLPREPEPPPRREPPPRHEPPPRREPVREVPPVPMREPAAPPSPPTKAAATEPDIPIEVLTEHFNAGVDALDRILRRNEGLDALADGPLKTWRSALDLLVLAGRRSATKLLLPILDDAATAEHRRTAAALLLLHLRGFDGPSALLERSSVATRAIVTAIEHWDSSRAEAVLEKALARSSEANKPLWWQVYWRRASDPGPALVSELLTSKDPARAKIGLDLLCMHAARITHAGAVDRHTFSSDPELKTAAIRAALVLGRASALVVCKQAARAPQCPEACLLHAVLANDKEFASLVSWGTKKGAPPHAAWVLGYSGRRTGIEACLSLVRDAAQDIAAEAFAGFRAATGFAGERSEVESWWRQNQGRFHVGTRYLRGRTADVEATKVALHAADARLWHGYRLELLVRSKGEVRLPEVGMPDQLSKLVDTLEIGLV